MRNFSSLFTVLFLSGLQQLNHWPYNTLLYEVSSVNKITHLFFSVSQMH